MSRVLTPTAERLLDDLPPYMRTDPHVQGYILALANESDRVMEMLTALEYGFLPHSAASEFNALALWETLLGLAVNPAGETDVQRQAKVVAFFRSRRAARGIDWVNLLSTILGSNAWEHEEGPGAYQVTIHIPYESGTYTVQAVETLARKITPAHLQVIATYEGSFIVGVSIVGTDIL